MSVPIPVNTALGLERLRGELREGLADIKGALNVLVLRSDQAERAQASQSDRMDKHETRMDKHEARLDTLEQHQKASADHGPRLKAVEKKVWTIGGGVAALVAVGELASHFLSR